LPPKNYRSVTVREEVFYILKALSRKWGISINDVLARILETYKKEALIEVEA